MAMAAAVMAVCCWLALTGGVRGSTGAMKLGFGASGRLADNEASSSLVRMTYHMGPVLAADINLYIIWYGEWKLVQKRIIRDFLASISDGGGGGDGAPTVAEWWKTVTLYTDQTGRNISSKVRVVGEYKDRHCSLGKQLSRIQVNDVIKGAIQGGLPVDSGGGVYLVLTADDVLMQDFCRAVCAFHYFTFPSIVGYTLPYAWVGNSQRYCPDLCAYPFAVPSYMTGVLPLAPPNGHIGPDAMISVLGHELAELSSDPLTNAWFAGDDPRAPTEIADLCEGIYGPGGGGGYPGQMLLTHSRLSYNMNGIGRRKFLVQWIWNPLLNACAGPNSAPIT